ncbi:LuxR family transcriptional regulator [Actinoplanes sp. M2I2]|uniref:helix-turn-helix transcriptional regulator n=1 Tax=Actinoplanes sp. M2I2 TaxID=1734444 RepID=UPI002022837F|nr:LuxR family transcriptional regulator [Actinoplanes sp. M2I2]
MAVGRSEVALHGSQAGAGSTGDVTLETSPEETTLLGRDEALAVLDSLVAGLSGSGTAVAITGAAGTGKTALLDHVADRAGSRGYLILRAAGLPCDRAGAGAGLHELVHPVLDEADDLPGPQRSALLGRFLLSHDPAPERLALGLAVLSLLERLGRRGPLLVLIDDLQWLDQVTVEVLTFVARRLRAAPILMVGALRNGGPGTDQSVRWPFRRIDLGPLPDDVAQRLVTSVAPALSAAARRRVLSAAEGNPLALREFATALSAEPAHQEQPAGRPLPVTHRMSASLLAGTDDLPEPTRRFLVLVAAAGQHLLPELVPAARRIGLRPEDLDPAEQAGLLLVTGDRVQFRQELMRSAVYSAATWSERAEAHEALAATTTDLVRATWHRTALAHDEDEDAAADLEGAADRRTRRGRLPEAVELLRRAAALSAGGAERSRRLAIAAELARQAGHGAEAHELIHEAMALSPGPQVIGRLLVTRAALSLTEGLDGRSAAEAVDAVAREASSHADDGRWDHETWAAAMIAAGSLAWYHDLPAPTRAALIKAMDDAVTAIAGAGTAGSERRAGLTELAAAEPTTATLLTIARSWNDPLGDAATVRRRLPPLIAALRDRLLTGAPPPRDTSHLLIAAARTAESLHDVDLSVQSWNLAADALTVTRGAAGDHVRQLTERGLTRILSGRPADAGADAAWAGELSAELGLPLLGDLAAATRALALAWTAAGPAAAGEIRRTRSFPPRTHSALVTAMAGWANGLAALREKRFGEAGNELTSLGPHRTIAWNAVGDLAEAAAGSGDPELITLARRQVDVVRQAADVLDSDHLRAVALRGAAVLDDTGAERHFQESAAAGRRGGVPLELARTLLAYGAWLRRTGQIVAAREHLGEARFLFGNAGAAPWAELATAELRAAGVTASGSGVPRSGADVLSPQELRVALLAAEGLTNREIGARIDASHRTVANYLYDIYPKLGITSRLQLRAAVGDVA